MTMQGHDEEHASILRKVGNLRRLAAKAGTPAEADAATRQADAIIKKYGLLLERALDGDVPRAHEDPGAPHVTWESILDERDRADADKKERVYLDVQRVPSAQHSTESNEHYTPSDIIRRVHELFGRPPDLDPASCALANETVKAKRFYSREENGFARPWSGKVFVNPPGGFCDAAGQLVIRRQGATAPCTETGACGLPKGHKHAAVGASAVRWYVKAVQEWLSGNVEQLVFVAFTLQLWQVAIEPCRQHARGLSPSRLPHALPVRRIPYDHPDGAGGRRRGGSPPHASAIIFMPSDAASVDRFTRHFCDFAEINDPINYYPAARERQY